MSELIRRPLTEAFEGKGREGRSPTETGNEFHLFAKDKRPVEASKRFRATLLQEQDCPISATKRGSHGYIPNDDQQIHKPMMRRCDI